MIDVSKGGKKKGEKKLEGRKEWERKLESEKGKEIEFRERERSGKR